MSGAAPLVQPRMAEMAQRASLFRRLIERWGPQVLEVVAQHTIEGTRERLEKATLERRDLQAVMDLLWNVMVPGTVFMVEEQTDSLLRLRVTRCLFADEMRRLGAAEIGDAFYCAYDHGFCQGLNPDVTFTRTKTLMAGDECCNHTYMLPCHSSDKR